MPLSSEQIKTLKQVNISKDPDKTKQRVKQDFSSASNLNKRAIEELSGQKRHSFYRAYNTGSVNARLVIAMSQILNVTPFYYTGEEDEKKPFDNSVLRTFLKQLNYKKLLESSSETGVKPAKRPYNRKQKAAPAAEISEKPLETPAQPDNSQSFVIHLTLPDSPEIQQVVAEMSEEEAVTLLKAMLIREKTGQEAGQISVLIKRCLLG